MMADSIDEWKATQTSAKQTYYYNRRTRETSWKRPPGLFAGQGGRMFAPRKSTEETVDKNSKDSSSSNNNNGSKSATANENVSSSTSNDTSKKPSSSSSSRSSRNMPTKRVEGEGVEGIDEKGVTTEEDQDGGGGGSKNRAERFEARKRKRATEEDEDESGGGSKKRAGVPIGKKGRGKGKKGAIEQVFTPIDVPANDSRRIVVGFPIPESWSASTSTLGT
ncbi:hypothetical protein TrRE_jg13394, partial [Triparma retinervis]